jgi:serine/threonine-protein kinase
MPHQRPEARSVLFDLLEPRQFLRVMSVLDRAFANELSLRFRTAPDFASELERAMRSDQQGRDDLEHLLAQVDEITVSRGLPAQGARRQSLSQLMTSITNAIDNFAYPRGLQRSYGGLKEQLTEDDEWQEMHMSVQAPGDSPTWAVYRVERRGAHEYVALVDGEVVWRGESADESLIAAVQMVAARQFLSTQADQ